jgi:hypothetical protein
MAIRIEELHEEDFYVWTRRQAEALRRLAEARPNVALDFPHLIEEVEALVTSQRDAVRSQVCRIIEHCLKLESLRSRYPGAGWRDPIIDARAELDGKLSPRCGVTSTSSCHGSGCRPGRRPILRCAGTASLMPPTCCRPTAPTCSTTC